MSESNGKDQVETPAETPADPMAMFHTRSAANEGVELPLYDLQGLKTEHWVRVVGADSDRFRQVELKNKREGAKIAAIQDQDERLAAIRELQLDLIASAVVAWSFPAPCTKANVMNFLREAPQIADSIDTLVSRRSLFFAKRSVASIGTPSKSSDLT